MSELVYVYYRRGPGNRKVRRPRRTACPRNWRYRAWIRSLPSAVSGYGGCEACHTGSDGGARMKASDYSCIPLTPLEHGELHRIGKRSFEAKYGIDCGAIASRLSAVWLRFAGNAK